MQNKSLQMIKAILKSAFGLFLYSCGVYLTVQANIGIAPWECLSMAISGKVGLSFGFVHTVSGIIILGIDLLLKEKIGFGTILDALLVGNYVDWISYFHPIPVSRNLCLSIILVIVGLFVMGFGQYFYMSAGQSCASRFSDNRLGQAVPKSSRRSGAVRHRRRGFADWLGLGWPYRHRHRHFRFCCGNGSANRLPHHAL